MTNRLTSFQHQFMHRALALLVYACLHLSVSIYGQTPPDSEEKLSQLQSLRGKPIPSPSQLDQFIADHQATIQLGKALFWDVQAGSDGRTACATCHYHAGADSRGVNTLAPPLLAQGGSIPPLRAGANATLSHEDFPFHRLADPNNRRSQLVRSTTDIVGSQGVVAETFVKTSPRRSEEIRQERPDPVFQFQGLNVRRVTPRNAPSVINAVFNLRNFWDGRAQDIFNGVNTFGSRDESAAVLRALNPAVMTPARLRLPWSSLASQAVGPPLSDIEMSADGRRFADIGKKLLTLKPLARQRVHSEDSVLGSLVRPGQLGLTSATYRDMIMRAFRPEWWQGTQRVRLEGRTHLLVASDSPVLEQDYNQMAWNFALFFGLAVQMYESTLISDQSPFDRYMEGQYSALTAKQQMGLSVFLGKGKCVSCHSGAEMSAAAVSQVRNDRIERMEFASTADPGNIEGDFLNTTGRRVIYDNGFYNIGVRPTRQDLGIGADDPFGLPLAESRLFVARQSGRLGIPTPAGLKADGRFAPVGDGAFKTPILRNVELTAPYFHDGGQLTLMQVVEFYNRGGDFRDENIRDIPPDITHLYLTEQEKEALVAFMISLTDERVRRRSAPFDHPQLPLPLGHLSGGATRFIDIPATGRLGGQPLPNFPLTPSSQIPQP